ncbi:MAG TPA: TonB-dependent receptor plug domain-containing protein, partial [Acidobacteriota bacterium]|nr:TonB-dependent receptor plug domain-containing protein [Acidobacteriota bacterium]
MISIIVSNVPVFSAPRQVEEKIVVTAGAYPVPFENLSRKVAIFTREDIEKLPVRSLADLIGHAVSADIASRAPMGIQADIRLRGSAFSQTLVMVDGMRINNSQTGHHNADFPVQLSDVERVEVLLGAGSSLYGADAFGGIVNIITRRDKAPTQASMSGGQHGLVKGAFASGFSRGKYVQSINFSGDRSTGFRSDRDFRSAAV